MQMARVDEENGDVWFFTGRGGTLAAEVDNLLQTGSTRSARDQNPVQRTSATQGFADGMDADQKSGAI